MRPLDISSSLMLHYPCLQPAQRSIQRVRRKKMVATYQVKAQEIDEFLNMFRISYADRDVVITVETAQTEISQTATNTRILGTVKVENSGVKPFKVMTMEELQAMVE
jgi:hypothetical protein